MSKSSLQGVCVGAGFFSHFQFAAWNRIPEVRITALCNRNVKRAEAAAKEHGIPKVYGYDQFEEMLEREKPDFIDLITPPETHLELVRIAAARGIAVICQKPLAPTMEECVAVVETAQKAGIRFVVHENWRWKPWYREIKKRQLDGTLGELHSISVCMRMGDGWQEDAYLARQPFFREYPRLIIYETGVHFLDTFRFLGGEINSITCRLQRRNPAIRGDDAGQVLAGFASGATALLDASRYNEAEVDDPRHTFGSVRVDAEKGHIRLDTDGRLFLKQLGQPVREIAYSHPRGPGIFAGDCVYFFQRHATDCLLTGQEFESTGEDYLKSIALMEACYESHKQGKTITLNTCGRE